MPYDYVLDKRYFSFCAMCVLEKLYFTVCAMCVLDIRYFFRYKSILSSVKFYINILRVLVIQNVPYICAYKTQKWAKIGGCVLYVN